MRKSKKSLVLLAVVAAAVGCSQEAPRSTPIAQAAGTSSPSAMSDPQVARVAKAFMQAIFAGDAPTAAQLLTSKAAGRYAADRSVLPAMGMGVDRLVVGEVRQLNQNEAAVQCLVTEAGSEAAQEIGCLLKREPAGWRVAGLAANGEEESATVISFEGDAAVPVPDSRLVEQPSPDTPASRTASGQSASTVR